MYFYVSILHNQYGLPWIIPLAEIDKIHGHQKCFTFWRRIRRYLLQFLESDRMTWDMDQESIDWDNIELLVIIHFFAEPPTYGQAHKILNFVTPFLKCPIYEQHNIWQVLNLVDEFYLAGEIQETSKSLILERIDELDKFCCFFKPKKKKEVQEKKCKVFCLFL